MARLRLESAVGANGWSTERKVAWGFSLALVLLTVIGVSCWLSLRGMVATTERVRRTQTVLESLAQVVSLVAHAESGQRSFVITGKPQYLERYRSALARLPSEEGRLQGLLADDPVQQTRLRALASMRARRIAILHTIIETRRARGFDAARRRIASDKGERAMTQLRDIVRDMEIAERALLAERTTRAAASVGRTQLFIGSGLLIALLLVAAASVAIRRDLAARRRVEQELRQTNVIFEHALDGIARVDADGRFVAVNAARAKILGYPVEEILGRSYRQFVHPEDCELLERATERMRREGRANVEVRGLRKDGSVVYQEMALIRVTDAQGRDAGAYGFSRDITARKLSESQLRASEARFRSIMESAPDALVITDRQGRLVLINSQTEELFGYRRDELIGKPVDILVPERFRATHPRHRAAYFASPSVRPMGAGRLLSARRKDGTEVPVEIGLSPFTIEDEPLVATSIRDISDRRRAEEDVRKARDAAEAASRAKSDFLARMSHEIRTPMNGIIGMTELALGADLPAGVREHLEMVKASADSLLTVINDILDFSKIEAGKFELDEIDFDIRDVMGDTMRMLAYRAHQKGLELAFQVDEAVPAVLVGDPARLRQVVVNLVGNALKFTDQGEVVVRVAVDGRHEQEATVHVSVADTGIGISPEKYQAIFRAFEQADVSTTRRYGGTGLGLAISAQLAHLMGGRMWVESELGRGSTFHVTARLRVDESGEQIQVVDVRGVRVLVVDDNTTNRTILDAMLRGYGMIPTLAASGEEALAALRRAREADEPFGLLLVDYRMPGMDGIALVEHVRDLADPHPEAIMMLTSDSQPGDVARCRDLGVAAQLAKPLKQSELLDTILNVLATHPGGRPRRAHPHRRVARAARPLRVLVAEDNVVNQKLAVALLRQRGHEVAVAANGREAVLATERESFDIVLMDVQMPEMDGFEATLAIRARELATDRHLRIVAMTANAMSGDRRRCLEGGMDDYVAKPIDGARLFAAVEEVADVAPAGPAREPAGTVFDSDAVLARVEGNTELLRQLIELFLANAPARLEAVHGAIAQRNAAALRAAAHALKGAASTLGGTLVADAARRLERMGGEGTLAGAEEVRGVLDAEMARFAAALEQLA